jgi:hypothetical protein
MDDRRHGYSRFQREKERECRHKQGAQPESGKKGQKRCAKGNKQTITYIIFSTTFA